MSKSDDEVILEDTRFTYLMNGVRQAVEENKGARLQFGKWKLDVERHNYHDGKCKITLTLHGKPYSTDFTLDDYAKREIDFVMQGYNLVLELLKRGTN